MVSVIIAASGTGERMGAGMPKQFLDLGGMPILARTIAAFNSMEVVTCIAVAVPQGYVKEVTAYGFSKVQCVVEGGRDRTASVYAALLSLPVTQGIVLVHDGVRPFVDEPLVCAVASAAARHGAAVACTPVTDTIKSVDENGRITATIDRNNLWRAQTPQGFTYSTLINAHNNAQAKGITATDDCALVERMGIPAYIVPSSPRNIKITTVEDMTIAKAFLDWQGIT